MENNIKYCIYCGTPYRVGDRFCSRCGAPLTPMAYAPPEQKQRKPSVIIALLQCLAYYGVYTGIQFVVQLVGILGGIVYQTAMGVPVKELYMDEDFLWITGIIANVLAIMGFAIFFAIRKKNLWKHLGMKPISPIKTVGVVSFGFGAQFGAIVIISILYSFIPFLAESGISEELEEMLSSSNVIGNFLFISIATALGEEVLFRGIIYNKLKSVMSVPAAVVISGLLFGLAHLNLEQFIYTVPLGIAMAIVYEKYKSFWAPFLVHAAFNGGNYLIGEVTFPSAKVESAVVYIGIGILLIATAFVFFTHKIYKDTGEAVS